MNPASADPDPEQTISKAELGRMLEEAVLALPEQYRTVLMLRDVEEMSTSETAAAPSLSEVSVKVRLHRGRAMVRRDLFARVGTMAKDAFPFLRARCDQHGEAGIRAVGRIKELRPRALAIPPSVGA